MQSRYQSIKSAGAAELIAISSDTVVGIRSLRHEEGIDYLLLSDGDVDTIDKYNVRETSGNPFLARPATFIVNESGKVAWVDLGIKEGHRTTSKQIITALNDL